MASIWRKMNFAKGVVVCILVATIVLFYFKPLHQESSIRKRTSGSQFRNGESSDDDAAMEFEMSRRLFVVRETCRRERLGKFASMEHPSKFKYPPTPIFEIFYFDRSLHLAWCPVYKAASTSWLYNFGLLAGVNKTYLENPTRQYSEILREVSPSLEYEEGKRIFDKSKMKFFIVRHPFERLLSVYRDKLEDVNIGKEHGTEFFYKKYGKKIVEKYRKRGGLNHPFGKRVPDRIEPTFSEFVDYLINHKLGIQSEEHWMPYYIYCTPCFLKFDAIVKMETIGRDQRYVIERAGLKDIIKPSWKHMTKGEQTSKLLQKYYSRITKNQLMKLYEKYQLDFDMFEYSIDEYLPFVK